MARIRSTHPDFFTDEDVVEVSPLARLLLIGLGTQADDKGVFPWKPRTIKMRLFPADNLDLEALLVELEQEGLIQRYEIDDKEWACIRNFRKHQRPKSPNDLYPMPNNFRSYVGLPPVTSEIEEVEGGSNGEIVECDTISLPGSGEIAPQMEGRVGEDVEKKDTSNEVSPILEAKQLYNIAADFNGWPKVMKMNKQREAKLRARLKDCGGLDGWQLALEKAGKSDFLCNRANKSFSASFDFLLQESSFTKLMEGNYDNSPGPNNGANFTGSSRPGRGTSEAFATIAARMSEKSG